MSDIAMPGTGPATPAAAPDPATPDTASAPEQGGEPAIDWKAKSRLWETRAKENKAAADRLKQIEDAAKSTEQRLAEQVAALQAQLKQMETAQQVQTWRAEVAAKTGLPADLLRGETLEELEAHAKAIQGYSRRITEQPPIPSEGQPRTTPKPTDEVTFVRQMFT